MGVDIDKIGTTVIVTTNEYSIGFGTDKSSFSCNQIGLIYFSKLNDYINMTLKDLYDTPLCVDYDPNNPKYVVVAKINGVQPTDLNDLFLKLNELR